MELHSDPLEVSVALATYNGARHLRHQLDTLAEQTVLPAELVVSDDNSSDDTLEIAKEFARTAPFPVRILPRHDQLGFSDNFLHAAEHCSSPLVMFCDQDDAWLPHKLEASRHRLQADDSLLLLHTLTLADDDLQPFASLSQGIERSAVFQPLDLDPFLSGYGNTMLFRRDLLHLFPRAQRPHAGGRILSHDTWVYTLAAALGRVSHLAESLILYRQHGGNVSNLDRRSSLQRAKDLATFDIPRYADVARFNSQMVALFDILAMPEMQWSNPAAAAARCYRQRQIAADLRLRTFTAPRFSQRFEAFLKLERMRRALPMSARKKALATLKDLLLGVFATGRRIR